MKITQEIARNILDILIECDAPLSEGERERADEEITYYDFENPHNDILYLGEWRVIPTYSEEYGYGINLCYNFGILWKDRKLIKKIIKKCRQKGIKFDNVWLGSKRVS